MRRLKIIIFVPNRKVPKKRKWKIWIRKAAEYWKGTGECWRLQKCACVGVRGKRISRAWKKCFRLSWFSCRERYKLWWKVCVEGETSGPPGFCILFLFSSFLLFYLHRGNRSVGESHQKTFFCPDGLWKTEKDGIGRVLQKRALIP